MVDQKTMQKLSELTKKLDSESDSHNKLVADLEKRLNDMGVAVTVWLDMDTSQSSQWTKTEDERGNEIEPEEWQSDYQLGYAVKADKWRLCVRKATYKKESSVYAPGWEWELKDSEDERPLLESSRALRVEAAEYFDSLISWLVQKTEEYLKNIEEAKKLV